jgi:hypothetical protein
MAQGSKSRVVIWTIVGILVVIAVILLVVGRKGAVPAGQRVMKPADVPGYVDRMNRSLERLEEQVAKAQAAGGSPDVFAKIADYTGRIRTGLQEMQGMTDKTQLTAKADELKTLRSETGKLLKSVGGADTEQ